MKEITPEVTVLLYLYSQCWLWWPVSGAVQKIVCCTVSPRPPQWLTDRENGEETEERGTLVQISDVSAKEKKPSFFLNVWEEKESTVCKICSAIFLKITGVALTCAVVCTNCLRGEKRLINGNWCKLVVLLRCCFHSSQVTRMQETKLKSFLALGLEILPIFEISRLESMTDALSKALWLLLLLSVEGQRCHIALLEVNSTGLAAFLQKKMVLCNVNVVDVAVEIILWGISHAIWCKNWQNNIFFLTYWGQNNVLYSS